MWVLAILHVISNKIDIKIALGNYSKSALFSQSFWAKILWVLAILRVTNIGIKIWTTLGNNLKSALFPLKYSSKKSGFMLLRVLKILKSKLKIPGVFT
jgi:hypothetical protein